MKILSQKKQKLFGLFGKILPLANPKLPLPRNRQLCWDREEREFAILGGCQQGRFASTRKCCCGNFPTRKRSFRRLCWDNCWKPVWCGARRPPRLRGAIGRIWTSTTCLPVFLLQVRTLGRLPADHSAVHYRVVVDFEVGQARLVIHCLLVTCYPLVNERP